MPEIVCDFLFLEGLSKNNTSVLYPIIIKYEGKKIKIRDLCTPRIEYASSLPIEHLAPTPQNNKNFVIVGAGPTIYGFVDELSYTKNESDTVCSVNGAHEFLIKRGITPDMHVLYEMDLSSVEQSLGGPPHKDVTYYVCSMCAENIFDELEGYKRVLWHTKISSDESGDYQRLISSLFPNEPFISIGYTSFLKCFGISQLLGYKKYELYGIDCSIPIEGHDHIEGYKEDDSEDRFHVWAIGKSKELRRYLVNATLMGQAVDFVNYCKGHKDVSVDVHGDGLLGFALWNRHK